MSLFEGDDCFVSSNRGRLTCVSPSESVTIPESDDVESDFDRFNDGLLSSEMIIFDCRELVFNVKAKLRKKNALNLFNFHKSNRLLKQTEKMAKFKELASS